jgi:2-amino-4-hydroxy-6-hydroxymethyldihydropteridine diphosphokinase
MSPLATCQAAAEALRGLAGLRLVRLSRWYATAPIPASEQPDYINGLAWLEGEADPARLLARLHAIEARAGRVRGAVNGPRVLDLDIIAMGGLRRAAPDPVLPHPRMQDRAFVLFPLVDLAPSWRHPGLGRSAAELLADLPSQDIRAL